MTIREPENISVHNDKYETTKAFFQSMLNRLFVGELRYGKANRRQEYFKRLKKEVQFYEITGNAEYLLNIANYCILEWIAPSHKYHHFDPSAESVTRNEKDK